MREVVTQTSVKYYDAEVPQDACAAGRVAEFGKASQPATTFQTRPYASGLSPNGELVAAQAAVPSFYRAALVAWAPALGATGYEVQWSKTQVPVEGGRRAAVHGGDVGPARGPHARNAGTTACAGSTRTCPGR